MTQDYQSCWRAHRNCPLNRSEADLVACMLPRDPRKRISLGKLQEHACFHDEVLSTQQVKVLTYRHHVMSVQMAAGSKKQGTLQHSVRVTWPKGLSMQQRTKPLPPSRR